MNKDIILEALKYLPIGIFIVLFIIWLVITHLNEVERTIAWLYRMFSWIHQRFEYGNVATNVQASVNTISEEFDRTAPGVLPYAMRIQWAKNAKDTESVLQNGDVIVTMGYSRNWDRNLVVATLAYLEKSLLPRARIYIDETLRKATDFTVAKKIFISSSKGLPMNFFIQNYIKPAIERDPQLRDDYTILGKLQDVGFLARIFLQQMYYFGMKIYPSIPDKVTYQECHDFALFLKEIAIKKIGEEVTLNFIRSKIRVSILIIASESTKVYGIKPYLRRVKLNLNRGIEHMYICARRANNISLAKQVAKEGEKANQLKIIKQHNFLQIMEKKESSAICIVCTLNLLTAPRYKLDSSDIVSRLLEEHIEELNVGQIKVITLARQEGIKTKIAVRSLVNGLDVINCCTEQKRLKSIETALGGEKIEFIKWSSDPKSFIIASLTPMEPNSVIEVSTDLEKKQAIVKVDGEKTKNLALGIGNQNLSCAMELTGWQITIKEIHENEECVQE